ncbi:hypothetical protein F5Y07DRAFT_84691 [Xylaria sp. FL0933]|nr:hypothetical protein F5Y07DRAFT_84691 [Xylaria sp. FL0933]
MVPHHSDWVYAEWGYAYYILHHRDDADTAEKCCKAILSKVFETKHLNSSNARVISTAEILLRIYEEQGRTREIEELISRIPEVGRDEARTSVDKLPSPRWRLKDPR